MVKNMFILPSTSTIYIKPNCLELVQNGIINNSSYNRFENPKLLIASLAINGKSISTDKLLNEILDLVRMGFENRESRLNKINEIVKVLEDSACYLLSKLDDLIAKGIIMNKFDNGKSEYMLIKNDRTYYPFIVECLERGPKTHAEITKHIDDMKVLLKCMKFRYEVYSRTITEAIENFNNIIKNMEDEGLVICTNDQQVDICRLRAHRFLGAH